MIISKDGKLFGKISIIDVIIVAVLAVLVVFCVKKFSSGDIVSSQQYTTVVFEFTQFDAPTYVYDNIEPGDRCIEALKSTYMGNVVSTDIGESVVYCTNSEGRMVGGPEDDLSTIKIVMEANGYIAENGGAYVDGTAYYIGKTYEIRAGKTALNGRITAAYTKES